MSPHLAAQPGRGKFLTNGARLRRARRVASIALATHYKASRLSGRRVSRLVDWASIWPERASPSSVHAQPVCAKKGSC